MDIGSPSADGLVRFVLAEDAEKVLVLPAEEVLSAFSLLGLPAEMFGAIRVRELAPLCRRALWPSRRAAPNTRETVARLLALAEAGGDGDSVLFT